MKEYFEQLIVEGINESLIKEEHKDLKIILIENYFDLIRQRLPEIKVNLQMKVVENLLTHNPDVLKEDFWVNYVAKALSLFDEATALYVYENSSWYVLLNRIQDDYLKIDWFKVLVKLSMAMAEVGKKVAGFSTVLDWLVSSDSKNLLNLLHRSETKKYPKELKMNLYRRLISEGLLDIKIARRIRSDTSGSLSQEVLSILFENRNCYSDDDFQNLIVQFADTKHKWVARYAAFNMPLHLAPYLMGVDDKVAMGILEKRMNLEE